MQGQLDIFSYLEQQEEIPEPSNSRLHIGDYIGRLVLGEIEKGRITKIEGNDTHFFYRTDRGICFNSDDRTDFEQMEIEAQEIRKLYKTIEIDKFDRFCAVQYPPRKCDGHILYAMVGIYNGMLYWKEDITYQFLEPVKNLEKAYKDKVFSITHNSVNKEERPYTLLTEPIQTERLYWSIHGYYASARYVETNG